MGFSGGSAAQRAAHSAEFTPGIRIIRCVTTLRVDHLRVMPGVTTVEQSDTSTILTSTQPEATLREMLALDQRLHSLEVQSPALEDAFLALTSQN